DPGRNVRSHVDGVAQDFLGECYSAAAALRRLTRPLRRSFAIGRRGPAYERTVQSKLERRCVAGAQAATLVLVLRSCSPLSRGGLSRLGGDTTVRANLQRVA